MFWAVPKFAEILIVLIVCFLTIGCVQHKQLAPIVYANGEELHGAWESGEGIAVFRGVPFAAPPVGDLRWRAPLANTARSGPQNATEFAPACMAARSDS